MFQKTLASAQNAAAASATADHDPFFGPLFPPGALVFDVGANIGKKAAMYLQRGAGRVICFEPQPNCAEFMRRAYAQTPEIVVVEKGLSHQEGVMTMSICSQANTISTFSDQWKTGRFADYQWDRSVDVGVTTLDNMIREFGRPDYCKIDVEGYEYEVLSGLTSPVPCLSFEFAREGLPDTQRCFKCLDALGYQEYNMALGEEERLVFAEWVPAATVMNTLHHSPDPLLWGDVYARQTVRRAVVDGTARGRDGGADTWVRRGEARFAAGDLTQARDCFGEALALAPRHVRAHNNLAVVAFQERAFDESIGHLEQALRAAPRHTRALENMARCWEAKGDDTQALYWWGQALEEIAKPGQ